MATNIPAKLKSVDISRFAMRAAQLEKAKPVVAYWLQFHIVQQVMAKGLHTADEECSAYISQLMDNLEQTKTEHGTEDAITDDVAAEAYCEQFALDIFSKADNAVRRNKVTAQTADTFRAAATFLDLLSFWKNPPSAEITAKSKFAKYHALRIAKAIKAGEDPNLSNPVQEATPPVTSPSALDPNDPEVQRINGEATPQAPYQPYVESAPNGSAQPSPSMSASRVSPTPPALPSAPTGYSTQHRDVSPISQPSNSRQGSVSSVGGGYFPRMNVPTFTADSAVPSLPTAPSIEDEPMTSPSFEAAPPTAPTAAPVSDPQEFYQSPPNDVEQSNLGFPPSQASVQSPQANHQALAQQPQDIYSNQRPEASPQSPQNFHVAPTIPRQPQYQSPPVAPQPNMFQSPAPPTFDQPMTGMANANQTFRTDEEAVLQAQKHAKWAVSALNFEDVETAVKELRIALRSLGASQSRSTF